MCEMGDADWRSPRGAMNGGCSVERDEGSVPNRSAG